MKNALFISYLFMAKEWAALIDAHLKHKIKTGATLPGCLERAERLAAQMAQLTKIIQSPSPLVFIDADKIPQP